MSPVREARVDGASPAKEEREDAADSVAEVASEDAADSVAGSAAEAGSVVDAAASAVVLPPVRGPSRQ